ncbi:tetratricopeptide repeat protein [Flavobacterium franklandianum]|uniref:tetratricopeptide repeat protein n=1 Tax=Flavobacterium franklandianum TaxID=2594430 RepID=UPI001179BD0F|nr:tetratricopeptide repeat protein [Flavobacterium franklandianum]TRX30079.1 tetratricopeptide repeat protein [Flavobacterium franklandianum]
MNEERYILFGQYIENELSAEEKTIFEKKLAEDKEFASTFEIFKELHLHLEHKFGNEQELKAFKKNLKSVSKEHFKAKKSKVIALKSWQYAAAASVAVLLGLFFFQNINPSFDDYNSPEMATFIERGDVNENLKLAQDAFNTKNYKAAIPQFEAVLKENKSPEIQYFYAVSLLEDNQFQKAETNLSELKSGTSVFKNKAIWYLALLKLKQNEYKSCKEILLTIPDDFEDYDQVQQLLNDLD